MAPTRWCGVTAQSVPLLSFGEVSIAIEATPRTRATRTARTAFGCRPPHDGAKVRAFNFPRHTLQTRAGTHMIISEKPATHIVL